MPSRIALHALLTVVLITAGCLGTSPGSPSETATPADVPDPETATTGPLAGNASFEFGPKERPERPAELNESSVRSYVEAYEHRRVYNKLWTSEYSEVSVDCRIDEVDGRAWGYSVVVTCEGSSTTVPPENSTATPGPIADWFTQSYRYRVSPNATDRIDVENQL